MPESSYQRIYRAVAKIPRGRVATYGQIAGLAGMPRAARQVGYALAALRDDKLPWHRVINAQGTISLRSALGFEDLQRHLLVREGVRFDTNGRVSLARYQWQAGLEPRPARRASKHPPRRRALPKPRRTRAARPRRKAAARSRKAP